MHVWFIILPTIHCNTFISCLLIFCGFTEIVCQSAHVTTESVDDKVNRGKKNPDTSTYRKHADTSSCWLENTLLAGWSDPESEGWAPCCSVHSKQQKSEQSRPFFLLLFLTLFASNKTKKKYTTCKIQKVLSLSLFGSRTPRSSPILSTQVTHLLNRQKSPKERARNSPVVLLSHTNPTLFSVTPWFKYSVCCQRVKIL